MDSRSLVSRTWPALLAIPLLSACSKDPDIGTDEAGTTETTGGDDIGTTETDTTETDTTETDTTETDTTETGEAPPPPLKSCREMLDCIFGCLGDLGLECPQTCGEGFDPAEAQKAGALVVCLGQVCTEKGQCSLDDITAPECVGCIGLGLFLPEPPGCEAEALACE